MATTRTMHSITISLSIQEYLLLWINSFSEKLVTHCPPLYNVLHEPVGTYPRKLTQKQCSAGLVQIRRFYILHLVGLYTGQQITSTTILLIAYSKELILKYILDKH